MANSRKKLELPISVDINLVVRNPVNSTRNINGIAGASMKMKMKFLAAHLRIFQQHFDSVSDGLPSASSASSVSS